MIDPRFDDLVAAYVLDALEPEERQRFEHRLEQDAELRAEVAAYRELAGALAGAAPRVAPPPSLKARILDEARRTGAAGGVASDGSAAEANDEPAGPDIGPAGTGPGSESAGRRDGPSARPKAPLLPWLAAAAGLIVAVGLGVVAQRAEQRRSDLESRLESVEANLELVEQSLADASSAVAERDSILATFLGTDVRTAVLAATDQPPSARIFWNVETSAMLVTAFNLPPAPDGRVYQLWGIAPDSNPVSLGTFQTNPDGTAVVQRAAPPGAAFEIGAVTEEPTGGSPQPTSQPFLVGSWTGS